ncbi:MAG: tetratricopeptide repeat protein [Nitrospiraceae bacterium]|nr:tetratricopeptide repeat protein [Nitrospira sp.]MCB9773646.1 tetratricopeptide repeat protein [Nitrospiraceae bacterium]
MSIIADTLQRLQTQTKSEGTETTQQAPLVLPAKVRREPGWHRRPSPLKFWLIGISMAIGLSSLGIGAYWIGLHLDFGMPTQASSLSSQRVALLGPPPHAKTPPADSVSFENTQIPSGDPVENLPVSAARESNEEPPPPHVGASMEPSSPLKVEPAPPTQPAGEIPASPIPATPLITPAPDHPQQKTLGRSMATSPTTTDVAPIHPSPDPKKIGTSPPVAVLAQTVQPGSDFVKVASANETGTLIPLEADVEEEKSNLAELTTSRGLRIEEPSVPANTAALTLQNEGGQVTSQNIGPPQQSPPNWLHHARELIQNGEYKEAQAMLSPLFHDPPVTWEPWFWMGTAYLGAGQLEQADQYFLSGLARNDKVPQLWIQRALVAQQQGSFQLAVHELRQAEALQPDLPHIHLNMGYAYERMGNNRLANQYFGRFLQLTEGQPEFFATRKKLFAR